MTEMFLGENEGRIRNMKVENQGDASPHPSAFFDFKKFFSGVH